MSTATLPKPIRERVETASRSAYHRELDARLAELANELPQREAAVRSAEQERDNLIAEFERTIQPVLDKLGEAKSQLARAAGAKAILSNPSDGLAGDPEMDLVREAEVELRAARAEYASAAAAKPQGTRLESIADSDLWSAQRRFEQARERLIRATAEAQRLGVGEALDSLDEPALNRGGSGFPASVAASRAKGWS